VDTLLLKLTESGVGQESACEMVRIGAKTSVHPSIHKYLAQEIAYGIDQIQGTFTNKPSTHNLHKVVTSAKIIGATALTIAKTPLLLGEHFDVVIVDEAGQISQPAILGPLIKADCFVLVGDHEQLPPLIQSETAEKAG
jgi:DNA replication ATP-dependent helicase Dna2